MNKPIYFNFAALLLIAIIIAPSCKSSKKVLNIERPTEKYEAEPYEPKMSIVNIPLKIEIKGVEKAINENIKGLVYEDKSYEDNDGDNVKLKVWKKGQITLKAATDAFEYYVPLKLWVKVRYPVFGIYKYKEVQGAIAFNFRTTYEIDNSWDLTSVTTLTNYKWLQKPTVNLLGMNISIEGIASSLLKSNKQFLETAIDDEIKKNLEIRKAASDAWSMLQDPINVNEDFNVWLKLTPQSVMMTPLKTNDYIITSTIGIKSIAEVVLSETKPEVTKNKNLPPFQRPNHIADSFSINLSSEIPFSEAEKVAKAQIVGQTFTQGKRTITIKDIELFGQGDMMVINATVDGSLKGNIYMVGKPVFDAATNTVKIDDVNFDVKTKNVLVRSAEWLFHSTIIKKIEPFLSFPLDNNLNDAKKMIAKQLDNYEPMKGILINGELKDLKVEGIQMNQNAIRVVVSTNGKIKMDVNGLNF